VIYIYFDRLAKRLSRHAGEESPQPAPAD